MKCFLTCIPVWSLSLLIVGNTWSVNVWISSIALIARWACMMELTNSKQWKDEPLTNYINCWRTLMSGFQRSTFKSINCASKGCIWVYFTSYMELSSYLCKVSNFRSSMELSISSNSNNNLPIANKMKRKKEKQMTSPKGVN